MKGSASKALAFVIALSCTFGCSPLIGLIVRSAQAGVSEISVGGSVRGSTRSAADNHNLSCGAASGGGDRAYTFVPETSGTYRVEVNAGYDCVLGIFDEAGESVGCNDDTGIVSHSQVEPHLEAGHSYTIVVDGYNGATGTFTLSLEALVLDAATDGSAADPDALALGERRTGTTAGRTDTHTPPCGSAAGSPDQVWSFTPDASGRYVFDVDSDFDGVLAIYADGSETPIACNDDHGTTRASRAEAELIAGRRYEVVIDGYHGSSGSYGVVVNAAAGPGVAAAGQVLNLVLNQPAQGDTRQGSDAHQPGCGSSPGALDQTWRVVPSVSGAFQFHVDAEYDSVLAIYEAGSATPMLCNDDFGSTRRSRLNTRLEAGRTYHVVVDGYARGSGTYTLTMSVANSGAAPSSGGGTIQLSQPVTGNTSAATDQRAPTCGSRPGTPDETWSFTVPQTAMYRIHVQAQYDSLLAVFTSTGTQLACNDDFQTTRASRIETSLTAGDTVYIVVDGFQGAQGTYQLVVQPMSAGGPSIPVAPTPTAPQVENITLMETRCANAPPLTAGRLTGRIVAADAAAVVTCGGGGVGGESIHRVEVTEATTLTVTATSPLRPALELRSGCSRGSTVVACVGPTNDRASTATVLTARLTPGQAYFLVVDSQTASDGVFTLETTLESGVETTTTPTP